MLKFVRCSIYNSNTKYIVWIKTFLAVKLMYTSSRDPTTVSPAMLTSPVLVAYSHASNFAVLRKPCCDHEWINFKTKGHKTTEHKTAATS